MGYLPLHSPSSKVTSRREALMKSIQYSMAKLLRTSMCGLRGDTVMPCHIISPCLTVMILVTAAVATTMPKTAHRWCGLAGMNGWTSTRHCGWSVETSRPQWRSLFMAPQVGRRQRVLHFGRRVPHPVVGGLR